MRSMRFDTLNKLLLVAAVLMMLLRNSTTLIFAGVFLTLFLLRAFSRDDYARERENSTFMQFFSRIKAKFTSKRGQRERPVRPVHSGYDAGTGGSTHKKPKADKEHRIYKCPNCKTYLRVPRGKGKILITCNNCGHKLNKKT